MRDIDSIHAVVEACKANLVGWEFIVEHHAFGPVLRIAASGKCNVTGHDIEWKGRKWLLSYHMTDGEIVQTAFMALMAAIEHETREQFTFKGASVFDPHYDIHKLLALRTSEGALQEREDGR